MAVEQLFPAKTVRHVCGISDRQLIHWISSGVVSPAKCYHRAGKYKRVTFLFDFSALVQIGLVRQLRDMGVSLTKIARVVSKLRSRGVEHWQKEWLLVTAGGDVVWSIDGKLEELSGKHAGQLVFSAVALPVLTQRVRESMAKLSSFEKPLSGEIMPYRRLANERQIA